LPIHPCAWPAIWEGHPTLSAECLFASSFFKHIAT
jgi:hypothetical protein